jgi:hypothetical protein
MDPEYGGSDEEDPAAQAMAATMGFSSFGSHRPTAKKRKFNPSTDAYVAGDELASLDKGGKKGQGSGGNTVPLGKTRVFGSAPSATNAGAGQKSTGGGGNQEEIDLGEDTEDYEEEPNYIDTSLPPPIESGGNHVQRYVDNSQPRPPGVSDEEATEMQARIDALLTSISAGDPEATSIPETKSEAQLLSRGHPSWPPFSDTAFMLGGPRPQSSSRDGFNDASSVASSSRPSERGQRNPKWYVGYYDPSFNDNPWAKLEEARGLEPLGRWPEHQGTRTVR